MGLFGGRNSGDAESNVDSFVSQEIFLPQVFLQPAKGEEHFRIYGHVRFYDVRLALLNLATKAGDPFWHSKIYLESKVSAGIGSLPSNILEVVYDGKVIGEISEFDTIARQTLSFEPGTRYVGRGVIRSDLIGNLIHVFVNPANKL